MDTPSESDGDSGSQWVGPTLSSLCQLMARPQLMTGVLRDHLTRHFYSAEMIEEPALRELVWQDNERTAIVIESAHRWTPATTEVRPGIIIKRNAYSNTRLGIGDRHMGGQLDRTGAETHATFWVGSHTLFCVAKTGAQAELLGTEVQRELTQFGPVLQSSLGLLRFAVTEVGEVGHLEESAGSCVVPVNCGYAYCERWQIRPQSVALRHISLSFILDA